MNAPAVPMRVGVSAQMAYGAGQVAGEIFRTVPSLLLLFFMTNVLGIQPAIAGAAIFVPKLVFGAICDVSVGIVSDRWQHRVKRRWWLLAGALGAPIAVILLFRVPEGSTTLRVAYVGGIFSLYMAVFAVFSVPYLALVGELASNSHDRTVLMAWRLVFTAFGVLTAGGLAPAIVQINGGGQAGYETMSIALAVICPASLVISFCGARRGAGQAGFVLSSAARVRLSMRQALAVVAKSKFSVLLGVTALQIIGFGASNASLLYFLTYNMARTDAFALLGLVALTACSGIVIVQPLWVFAARRLGKKSAFVTATLIHGLVCVVWALAAAWGTSWAIALALLSAFGNAGWVMLGFSMLSDITGEDEAHSGLYSAVWIAVDKIAFAFGGTMIAGLVLSSSGFNSARAVAHLPQSSGALTGIMLTFGLIPAALNLIAAAIFARWGESMPAAEVSHRP